MASPVSIERFSTVAEVELVVGGKSYSVGQVAPAFIILKCAADIPAGAADLYIRIEGEEELHRRIRLPQGASADSPRVVIERID
jgi:hypothetical protein